MACHRQGLESRQVLLAHLMDMATELFAMAATCAYAHDLDRHEGREGVIALADVFCRAAAERYSASARALSSRLPRPANRLADRVLDGDLTWLEEGIIPCPDGASAEV